MLDVSLHPDLVLLGQEQLDLPGQQTTSTGEAGGAGGNGGNGGSPPSSGLPGGQIMYLIILAMLAMIVFSMLGQRRDRKKREATLRAIKKHDRVQTIGGMKGSVVEIKGDEVVLKVDESSNTRITFAKSAVQDVLSGSPGDGDDVADKE